MEKKIYRKILVIALLINSIILGTYLYINLYRQIPNEMKILVNQEEKFDLKIPIKADISSENIGVLNIGNQKISSDKININLNKPFIVSSTKAGSFKVNLKLFGILNFKKIDLDVIEETSLIPGGEPIGLYIDSDGVLVLGSGKVIGEDGVKYEPILEKIKSGDYITQINGRKVSSKEELINEIQNEEGKEIELLIRRDKKEQRVKINPIKTSEGEYKIGAWIRDSTQGIGTLSFITKEGGFGALGHGVSDVDTGVLMEIKDGTLHPAKINSIIKGKEGEPGEIIGTIDKSISSIIGHIENNTIQGVFGGTNLSQDEIMEMESIPIGLKQEIKLGKAFIRSNIEGETKDYEIEIEKIDLASNSNKGMVIKIIDKDLIEVTGGIVQGMSGTPIIQDDKIVGAVTHVFVQDSTKGYGTFIEYMINDYSKEY